MKDPGDRLSRQFPLDLAIASGFPLILGPLGLLMLKAVPTGWLLVATVSSMTTALAGGILMTFAKWPLYKDGKFLTIGAPGLPESNIRQYGVGMRLAVSGLIVGAVLVFVLWLPG